MHYTAIHVDQCVITGVQRDTLDEAKLMVLLMVCKPPWRWKPYEIKAIGYSLIIEWE